MQLSEFMALPAPDREKMLSEAMRRASMSQDNVVYRDALRRIDAEVSGCGPDVSKDFLRLALVSVQDIARGALRR